MARAKSKRIAQNDIKLQAAMKGLADGTYTSVYSAANAHGLSHKTLGRHVAGGKSCAEAKKEQQKNAPQSWKIPKNLNIDYP
jgi:hypothetical protein